MIDHQITRRSFCQTTAFAATVTLFGRQSIAAEDKPYALSYILGSSMYGITSLAEILPEVRKTNSTQIDIWPLRHGNQREQIKEMGDEAFAQLLEENKVTLGMLTHYDLGPMKLESDMAFAKKFGAKIMICGSGGPKGKSGPELKTEVKNFVERMKPHVAAAEEHGVIIGIENHASSLIDSPDSLRWLAELSHSKHLGIAMAPYHLPDDSQVIAKLIKDCGNRLAHFYAWQHGMGCHIKLPKEQELLQMPGRGSMDFTPIVAAMKKINYQGWTEIFMHPVPRGIPILETTSAVTAEINRARNYLDGCLKKA